MDADLFKAALAGVCAPVTVVTAATEDGTPHGTTVSAMSSLSLDPPMVTVALGLTSSLLGHVRSSMRVGINVLSHDQAEVAMAFARTSDDRFAGIGWSWADGLPRLDGVGVWIAGEVTEMVRGGDHELLLTSVLDADVVELAPLIYGQRLFGTHSGLATTGVSEG